MNVLVTGGGGFLGSHLARRLYEMGHHVSVLGRRRYPGLPPNIIQHQADLRDPKAVAEACREQDSVFHAGALPGIWGTQKDFYQTNVDGTRYVIDGCLEHGIRKLVNTQVYIGSSTAIDNTLVHISEYEYTVFILLLCFRTYIYYLHFI